jgi:hypothetical protein
MDFGISGEFRIQYFFAELIFFFSLYFQKPINL